MIKNSAPKKWKYKTHTEVKHVLFEKYLKAWIPILGSGHRVLCYVDGFAGRGEYNDGTLGSPIIALRTADKYIKKYPHRHFIFFFIEKDKKNFNNLKKLLELEIEKQSIEGPENFSINPINGEFAQVIEEVLNEIEKKEKKIGIIPAFFFVDPFGFSGIPFGIIKRILSKPKTEVFFTFMIREIRRFLRARQVQKTLTSLFGTKEWESIIEKPNSEKALIYLYRKQLHEEAEVKYSLHFRVCEDERVRSLYYLIHATNHFKGHSIMKQIMHQQSTEKGLFAHLGPKDIPEGKQYKLFDINDIEQLKKILLERFKGKSLTYDEIQKRICDPWYYEPPYIDKDYREALHQLEDEGKIKVERISSKKTGLKEEDRITFPNSNSTQVTSSHLTNKTKTPPKMKIHYKEYLIHTGEKRLLVAKVNDGSIIIRFNKTPPPIKKTDVVCPHFLELKWAYGCPFDCSWCYLKGTFRFRREGISPVVKPYDKIKLHIERFLEEAKEPEILNTGEIADSLMNEDTKEPFSKFIIPIFERQSRHKVLFLTKASNVKHLLEIEKHNQAIISFSLNALPVAEKWEKAPHVLKRIEAAKQVFDAGYEVRIRIDPMVPIENWEKHYLKLLEIIFKNFNPERITLGSLRGLQSTINGCTDKTWTKYLKESSNWGKKIDFKTRYAMYSKLIQELKVTWKFERVALCKETIEMWDALEMDYKKIKCNCIW